jgi:trehalose/maltose transport system substrate-binding protein
MFRKKFSLLTLIAILAVTTFSSFAQAQAQNTITLKIFLGSVGDLKKDQEQLDRFMKANPNIKVETVLAPQSATDILGVIQQFLGAKSTDIDVIQFDTIWPGILAANMVDLKPYIEEAKFDTSAFYPTLYTNNIVGGKVVGLPWFTDAGLLYYRTDLLKKYGYTKAPSTWAELETMAMKIQEGEKATNKDFWGFVWQGNSYEGLTCDALEWQVSNSGGYIVEADGTISVNNPKAIAAIERAKGWVGKISPPGVTKYQEEDARGVFQAGNAAFMRNWPYAYVLGNGGADGKTETKIKGLFDVAPLPAGDSGKGAAALGGWQLGVSAYSKNPKEAAKLVMHLVGKDEQKTKALTQSNLPTIKALYTDADIAKQIPFIANLVPVFENASPRPSTVTAAKYNEVSIAYFTAVHNVLTGKSDAKTAFADLEVELKQKLGDKFKVGMPATPAK